MSVGPSSALRDDVCLLEVMSRQATINIGTIGHVAHGKSTVVQAMSGVRTTKYKKEAIMNITIHLGYANAKIFKCERCEAPKCYQSFGSKQSDQTNCQHCGSSMKLARHVSFVDCPGHDVLMATMLNGAAIMDAALLLIAANESFPQPQTLEHLSVIEILQLRHLIVLQNKIDLVKDIVAADQKRSICQFLKNSTKFVAPVIPICAQLGLNIDVVLQYICHIPQPPRQLQLPSQLVIVRTFDTTVPGDGWERLQGGVLGGSLHQGILRCRETIEIRPGIVKVHFPEHDDNGTPGDHHCTVAPRVSCTPLNTVVASIRSESQDLPLAIPGGLVAVGTLLDPCLTRQNKLSGAVCGPPGSLPNVYIELEVHTFLLTHVVGVRPGSSPNATNTALSSSRFLPSSGQQRVAKLAEGEVIQINCKTMSTAATVVKRKMEIVKLRLVHPVCCSEGDKIAISRLMDRKHRLIGWGTIRRGVPVDMES